jgi:hypothetical protein
MHREPIIVTLIGAILLLCGCRSRPSTPAEPTIPRAPITDSCALLTPAEISAAIGVPITPGKHVLPTSEIMCSWPQTGTTGDSTRVMLNFTSLDSFTKEKTPTNPRVTTTPVSGIADESFYVNTEFGISLYVRKANTAFVVGVHDKALSPDQIKAAEKTLALNAAEKL